MWFDTFWHKTLNQPYRLACKIDRGRGRPVLALHGIGSDGRHWLPLAKRLDLIEWRLIAPDLLGFGLSPKPASNSYSVEEHARMVVAVLERKGLHEPLTIVGQSMGCLVAVHIATSHPDLVERLILYEPPLFADSPEYRSHARRRKRYFALYDYISTKQGLLLAHDRLLTRTAKRLSGFVVDESTWLPFERSIRNTIMRQTAFQELHGIRVPTDIIHGRLDFVVTRSEVKKMFLGNPYIHLHTVNDVHGITPRAVRMIARLLERPVGR